MNIRLSMTAAVIAVLAAGAPPAFAQSAKTMYEATLARDQTLRAASRRGDDPRLKDIRAVVAAYEAVVKRHPSSGYADNALYQAAMLSGDAYRRLLDERDRRTTVRLLKELLARYPTSRLVPIATKRLAGFTSAPAIVATAETKPTPPAVPPDVPKAPDAPKTVAPPPANPRTEAPAKFDAPSSKPAPAVVAIKDIKRIPMPEVVRVMIELEGEVPFHEERVENPARMFVDMRGTRAAAPLLDAVLTYTDDAVKKIRIGRHPQSTTRVVLDLTEIARYTVFTLYNPYRIVIDCERRAAVQPPLPAAPPEVPSMPVPGPDVVSEPAQGLNAAPPKHESAPPVPPPLPSISRPTRTASAAPSAILQGGFSLASQLGLGVSRIVIDPGHGGHDPGASGAGGVVESALVLDVALRLEKLLLKERGVEVVMTRRTDEFIPLEARTAMANREGADLFLSIHANASPNNRARGVETYFLNFASNPEAEAVAARENLTSGRTMNSLPDIVKAIALNTKLDESRDFASMVQQSMVQRLRAPNKALRDLGVKQAPFVVLIGAAMPSVLAEISFVTNRQEAALLKTAAYKQRIAEALFNAVVRYQRSLKNVRAVARRDAPDR